jgi:hypothetical protein
LGKVSRGPHGGPVSRSIRPGRVLRRSGRLAAAQSADDAKPGDRHSQ